MASGIVRQQTPEEAELLRKREELASVRAALAERELELADLQAQLRSFGGEYLRQVGTLYAELDHWDALTAELEAELEGSSAARARAKRARERANDTHAATHGEESHATVFQPPPDLKSLFRDVAKRIHPDFAIDDADLERRTRLMADANKAYAGGDRDALNRILDEYGNADEPLPREGIGAELIRIIRQIATARQHLADIDLKLGALRDCELAKLWQDVRDAREKQRDLLKELADAVSAQVARARNEYEALKQEAKTRGT